ADLVEVVGPAIEQERATDEIQPRVDRQPASLQPRLQIGGGDEVTRVAKLRGRRLDVSLVERVLVALFEVVEAGQAGEAGLHARLEGRPVTPQAAGEDEVLPRVG